MLSVKERPILFSAPMVRAILEGRKTQTRRAVKGIALDWLGGNMFVPEYVADPDNGLCPYGFSGDRLWVRETWRTENDAYNDLSPSQLSGEETILYDADGDWSLNKTVGRGRPSIHMPRWASRITLEITGVRVERLQDISEADAIAEGTQEPSLGIGASWSEREVFAKLWESINGSGSWAANPWVWVIEFTQTRTE